MYGSIARRAALALSVVVAVGSVAVGPTSVSAQSLFQGALAEPSPTPTQPAWPSAANPFEPRPFLASPMPSLPEPTQSQFSQYPGQPQSQFSQYPGQPQGQQPSFTAPALGSPPMAAPSLAPVQPPQPDVKVTSLGIVRGASGEAFSFRVENVGKGIAPEVRITRQAVVKRKGERTWVRNEVSTYAHQGGLRPGEEIVVEVTCPANDRQFCDLGSVLADVVGLPEDLNLTNNHMVELGDIKG